MSKGIQVLIVRHRSCGLLLVFFNKHHAQGNSGENFPICGDID